jgi:oligopeptidase A
MDNRCCESQTLTLISGHYQTGEPIPNALFKRMRAARNFQGARQALHQLELALFDMRLLQITFPEMKTTFTQRGNRSASKSR